MPEHRNIIEFIIYRWSSIYVELALIVVVDQVMILEWQLVGEAVVWAIQELWLIFLKVVRTVLHVLVSSSMPHPPSVS